ncbi:unnamed protein product [Owenia fusiformis]|uniref:Uncharacterized protein n=1 Tax=Owenia fusiformis TaxID=6347 RepID=A0A8S4PSY0_OWEFU|nr:unnamed protein product [Owenia fusiformis]
MGMLHNFTFNSNTQYKKRMERSGSRKKKRQGSVKKRLSSTPPKIVVSEDKNEHKTTQPRSKTLVQYNSAGVMTSESMKVEYKISSDVIESLDRIIGTDKQTKTTIVRKADTRKNDDTKLFPKLAQNNEVAITQTLDVPYYGEPRRPRSRSLCMADIIPKSIEIQVPKIMQPRSRSMEPSKRMLPSLANDFGNIENEPNSDTNTTDQSKQKMVTERSRSALLNRVQSPRHRSLSPLPHKPKIAFENSRLETTSTVRSSSFSDVTSISQIEINPQERLHTNKVILPMDEHFEESMYTLRQLSIRPHSASMGSLATPVPSTTFNGYEMTMSQDDIQGYYRRFSYEDHNSYNSITTSESDPLYYSSSESINGKDDSTSTRRSSVANSTVASRLHAVKNPKPVDHLELLGDDHLHNKSASLIDIHKLQEKNNNNDRHETTGSIKASSLHAFYHSFENHQQPMIHKLVPPNALKSTFQRPCGCCGNTSCNKQ